MWPRTLIGLHRRAGKSTLWYWRVARDHRSDGPPVTTTDSDQKRSDSTTCGQWPMHMIERMSELTEDATPTGRLPRDPRPATTPYIPPVALTIRLGGAPRHVHLHAVHDCR